MTELDEDIKDVDVDASDLPELRQSFDACDTDDRVQLTPHHLLGDAALAFGQGFPHA